jgi:hypothetical protein
MRTVLYTCTVLLIAILLGLSTLIYLYINQESRLTNLEACLENNVLTVKQVNTNAIQLTLDGESSYLMGATPYGITGLWTGKNEGGSHMNALIYDNRRDDFELYFNDKSYHLSELSSFLDDVTSIDPSP